LSRRSGTRGTWIPPLLFMGPYFGAGVLTSMCLFGGPAVAQVAPALPPIFDPTGRSGEPPPPLKEEFQAPETPPPRPILPKVPTTPQEPLDKKLGSVRVFVRDIKVTGSTVFSDAELAEVTEPYRNRVLTTEDLERVRLALTLLYVNRGCPKKSTLCPWARQRWSAPDPRSPSSQIS
jgi:hemolysin activation/secretion protein